MHWPTATLWVTTVVLVGLGVNFWFTEKSKEPFLQSWSLTSFVLGDKVSLHYRISPCCLLFHILLLLMKCYSVITSQLQWMENFPSSCSWHPESPLNHHNSRHFTLLRAYRDYKLVKKCSLSIASLIYNSWKLVDKLALIWYIMIWISILMEQPVPAQEAQTCSPGATSVLKYQLLWLSPNFFRTPYSFGF